MDADKLKKIKLFGSIGAIAIAGVIIAVQFMSAPEPGTDLSAKDPAPAPAAGPTAEAGKKGGKPKVWQTDRGTTVTEDNGIVVERVGGGVVAPGGG
jgi:hypothetical protein